MENVAIGIDIGGTSIKAVLLESSGRWNGASRVPTEVEKDGRSIFEKICGLTELLIARIDKRNNLCGIGIGTPGFVRPDGTVFGAANLAAWDGFNLNEAVLKRFGVKSITANDASCMALAEARFGAARDAANAIVYTLGTGIGGGIVINHKLYTGTNGMAGEFGHVVVEPHGIPCSCGQRGCVERYASATGIVAAAREMADRCDSGTATPFVRAIAADPFSLSSTLVYDYVARGDLVARAVNERACEMLARAVGAAVNLFAPERVVFGGGVMRAGTIIIDTIKKHLPRFALAPLLAHCELVMARLGDDAGAVGAGALVFEEPRS